MRASIIIMIRYNAAACEATTKHRVRLLDRTVFVSLIGQRQGEDTFLKVTNMQHALIISRLKVRRWDSNNTAALIMANNTLIRQTIEILDLIYYS